MDEDYAELYIREIVRMHYVQYLLSLIEENISPPTFGSPSIKDWGHMSILVQPFTLRLMIRLRHKLCYGSEYLTLKKVGMTIFLLLCSHTITVIIPPSDGTL